VEVLVVQVVIAILSQEVEVVLDLDLVEDLLE
jgi:hypothetical protein